MPNTKTFDEMVALHQADPAALDAYREQALRALVSEAPEAQRPRLSRLVDKLLAEPPLPDPLENAARSFRLAQDSYVGLLGALGEAKLSPTPMAADKFLRLAPVAPGKG